MRIVVVVVLSGFVLLGHCDAVCQAKESVVGKWRFESIRRAEETEPVSKLLMEIVVGKNSYKHFFPNHLFTSYDNDSYGYGRWRLTDNDSKIVLANYTGAIQTYDIPKNTTDSLVIFVKNKYVTLLKIADEGEVSVEEPQTGVRTVRATVKQIAKKWVLKETKHTAQQSKASEMVSNAFKGSWLELLKDGTCTRKFTTLKTGRWNFEDKNTRILIMDDAYEGQLWNILAISSRQLILQKPHADTQLIYEVEVSTGSK